MGVTTCVVAGVTTCVCVSTTVRGGVEHKYRMILVKDAVAEINRATHEAELQTMARLFADVHTTDEVVAMLASATTARGERGTCAAAWRPGTVAHATCTCPPGGPVYD
jgi:ureidoacrylate peracid hydrolase